MKTVTIRTINKVLDAHFPRMTRIGHKRYSRGYTSNTEVFYDVVQPGETVSRVIQRIVYIRTHEIDNAEIIAALAAVGITAMAYMDGGLKVTL